jgi:hypothetical protein
MLPITDYRRRYIVTNFAYGTGPFLRTTDLAIAFNREYEKLTGSRLGIIVPWLYGERQKQVMLEEFSEHEAEHPAEILLDRTLGALYSKVFYGSHNYADALTQWVEQALLTSREAYHHLSGELILETLSGDIRRVRGKDIALELNRSPRIRFGVAPSYFTSFASLTEILEQARTIKNFVVSPKLLKQAIETAREVERGHEQYAIAHPGTFSYQKNRQSRFEKEILVPPIAPPPKPNRERGIKPGIFVTVTGIPGLERLYREASDLGLALYSNDTDSVSGSTRALPHIISNKSIRFQFARSGWSSVWISMISGTPLLVPEYDPTDDPEICFNNRCVEALGIAIVYRGEPLSELLSRTDDVRSASRRVSAEVKKRFGTLDGNTYCAKLFAKDFVTRYK